MATPVPSAPWKVKKDSTGATCTLKTSKKTYQFVGQYFDALTQIVAEHNLEVQGAVPASSTR